MKALIINNVINTGLDGLLYSYSENVYVRLYVCDFQKGVDSTWWYKGAFSAFQWEQFSETFNAYLNTLGEMNQQYSVGQSYNAQWNKRWNLKLHHSGRRGVAGIHLFCSPVSMSPKPNQCDLKEECLMGCSISSDSAPIQDGGKESGHSTRLSFRHFVLQCSFFIFVCIP